MIIHLIFGALAMAAVFLLMDYASKNNLSLKWWHWTATVLGILYTMLVLEMIYGFLDEGALQAALVIGLAAGIVAVVWGVLLRRFVFKKA